MKLRRIIAAAAVTTVATGATLLLSSPTSAVTPPAPTPISFDATGLSSTSCPVNLPLNNKIALPPGTAIQFKPGLVNGLLATLAGSETLSVTHINAKGQALSGATSHDLPWTKPVTYAAGDYRLEWKAMTLFGVVTTSGTGVLQIATGAAKCQLAIVVPGVGVNPSKAPIVGGIVGSILPPINVPPVTVPLPGSKLPNLGGAKTTGPTKPSAGASYYLKYKPLGQSAADSVVPKGYGNGNGAASQYVPPGLSDSINAGASNNNNDSAKPANATNIKSGGSPKTVDLASNRNRSALGELPGLLVILAVIALSGASAFYARTFLLHRPAKA